MPLRMFTVYFATVKMAQTYSVFYSIFALAPVQEILNLEDGLPGNYKSGSMTKSYYEPEPFG